MFARKVPYSWPRHGVECQPGRPTRLPGTGMYRFRKGDDIVEFQQRLLLGQTPNGRFDFCRCRSVPKNWDAMFCVSVSPEVEIIFSQPLSLLHFHSFLGNFVGKGPVLPVLLVEMEEKLNPTLTHTLCSLWKLATMCWSGLLWTADAR